MYRTSLNLGLRLTHLDDLQGRYFIGTRHVLLKSGITFLDPNSSSKGTPQR